jgi:hypothetical protein
MFILTLAKKVYIKYCCSTVVAVAVSARVTLDDPIIAKAGDRVHTFVRVVRALQKTQSLAGRPRSTCCICTSAGTTLRPAAHAASHCNGTADTATFELYSRFTKQIYIWLGVFK